MSSVSRLAALVFKIVATVSTYSPVPPMTTARLPA
jgi:hypothetical protein